LLDDAFEIPLGKLGMRLYANPHVPCQWENVGGKFRTLCMCSWLETSLKIEGHNESRTEKKEERRRRTRYPNVSSRVEDPYGTILQ